MTKENAMNYFKTSACEFIGTMTMKNGISLLLMLLVC